MPCRNVAGSKRCHPHSWLCSRANCRRVWGNETLRKRTMRTTTNIWLGLLALLAAVTIASAPAAAQQQRQQPQQPQQQQQQQQQPQQQRPNIIFIMGDDIGWANIGAYN